MSTMPVLFLSHESPYLWDTESPAHHFLGRLSQNLPRPRVIAVISAHWRAEEFTVSSAADPETIYDFGGFSEHYFAQIYRAPGAPDVADQIVSLGKQNDIMVKLDANRGLDHAVWIPVGLMYPRANIPVLSVSLKITGSPKEHYDFGRLLEELRRHGVLIIGSGTATHNLHNFFRGERAAIDAPPEEYAQRFAAWLKANINDPAALEKFYEMAPHAQMCHPTPDHFLPLLVTSGAAGGDPGQCIHDSFNYADFAMTSFLWSK